MLTNLSPLVFCSPFLKLQIKSQPVMRDAFSLTPVRKGKKLKKLLSDSAARTAMNTLMSLLFIIEEQEPANSMGVMIILGPLYS